MKNLTLLAGGIILLLNLIFGLILSAYKPLNIGLNSAVIIINTLMLYLLGVSQIKDGYKISLSFLFIVIAAIEFLLALFITDSWENNIVLIMLILLIAVQILLYAIVSYFSKFG